MPISGGCSLRRASAVCSPGTSAAACRSARRVSLRLARPDRAARYGLADWQVCPALPIGRPRLASQAGPGRSAGRLDGQSVISRRATCPPGRSAARLAAGRVCSTQAGTAWSADRPAVSPAGGRPVGSDSAGRSAGQSVSRPVGRLARPPARMLGHSPGR